MGASSSKTQNFETIQEGSASMKFDYVIGNPPYQEMLENTSDRPVYNDFMEASYRISDKVELITPARFLFNAGKTPKEWNQKMLNDPHLTVLMYEQQSAKVFANTDIKGGVVVTYRDETKNYGEIGTFTSYPALNAIVKKVVHKGSFSSIEDWIFVQNKFDLEMLYTDHPEYRKIVGSGGKEKRLTTPIFSQLGVFSDERRNQTDLKILGLISNKRFYRYIDPKYIEQHENLKKYKVILPKSNGSGAIGEVLSTPLIGEPLIGYTQSFISIGALDTKNEAEALLKYVKSKFMRTMLGVLKVTQDNNKSVWKYVPLQDFTAHSDIDWSKSVAEIDQQLYRKYDLTADEIEFIETHVKEMA
ncbi:MAG: Eco57I restriction-modification methylase domain-containing protein [Faecalibacterium prausnitzii]